MNDFRESQQGRIVSLEILRITLAIFVLLQHANTFAWRHGLSHPFTSSVGVSGDAAVLSFIQLSGFLTILRYPAIGTDANRSYIFNYLKNRVLRIWPEYSLSLIVGGLILYFSSGRLSFLNPTPMNLWGAFEQIILVHAWPSIGLSGPGWNAVTWSLSIEWLLYLLTPFSFAWIIRAFRSRHCLAVLAFLVLVVGIEIQHPFFPAEFALFSKCAMNYLIGIGCGIFVSQHWPSFRSALLRLGVISIFSGLVTQYFFAEKFAYILVVGSPLILLGASQQKYSQPHKLVFWLGSNAYGVFLWHSLLLLLVDSLFPNWKINAHSTEVLLLISLIFGTLVLADIGRRFGNKARELFHGANVPQI